MPNIPPPCQPIQDQLTPLTVEAQDLQSQIAETTSPLFRARLVTQLRTVQQQIAATQNQLQACIAQNSSSTPPVPPDGTLVKTNSSPNIYVIQGGQRHLIPDSFTLEIDGYSASSVVSISDAQMNTIPLGAPVPVPTRLLEDTGQDFLGAGHYMQSRCAVDFASGQIVGWTRTWTITMLGGYHGAVLAYPVDGSNLPVQAGQRYFNRWGVDGRLIGQSDTGQVPWDPISLDLSVVRNTRQFYVIHTWAPDSFLTILNRWEQQIQSIETLIKLASDISHAKQGTPSQGTGAS